MKSLTANVQTEQSRVYGRDVLTGNMNRYQFEKNILRMTHENRRFTIILLSIDKFGVINEFYGHHCGDQILKIIGVSLVSLERMLVYRFSGSQFGIITSLTDESAVYEKVEEIRNCIEREGRISGVRVSLTVSAAIVPSGEGLSVDAYYSRMNTTLRYARKKGVNSTLVYNDFFEKQLSREVELEMAVQKAIDHDEFDLFFQPIYRLDSKKTWAFEVLLRWQKSKEHHMDIGQMIAYAEQCSLIGDLDRLVIEKVFKTIANHRRTFEAQVTCINISPQSFLSDRFFMYFFEQAGTYDIDLKKIELEITEHSMIYDMKKSKRMMDAYKKLGVKFALDDFGTKYSSINYIKELPFDVLKIDKSYVDSICSDSISKSIVKMILGLCNELNLVSIAEGIEEDNQDALLREMGCTLGQGYLVSKPQPLAVILAKSVQ